MLKLINFLSALQLQVARELVTGFKDEINNYLNLVVNQTENDLGRCGPLANVYNSVRSAGCNRIVNPLVRIKLCYNYVQRDIRYDIRY